MLGFDPWYRAWTTQEERLVLNAVLFPAGTAIAATSAAREKALSAAHASPATAPLTAARLPATHSRPCAPAVRPTTAR